MRMRDHSTLPDLHRELQKAASEVVYYKKRAAQAEASLARLREALYRAIEDRHDSDCARHNGPAFEPAPCDCSLRAALEETQK